jgi:hypothetical protein
MSTCAICLEDCDSFSLECKHFFHINCLYFWSVNGASGNKDKCPYCMKQYSVMEIKEKYLNFLFKNKSIDEKIVNLIAIPGVKINNSYILFYIDNINEWFEQMFLSISVVQNKDLKKGNSTIKTNNYKIGNYLVGFVFDTEFKMQSYNNYNNNNVAYIIKNLQVLSQISRLEYELTKLAKFDEIQTTEKIHNFSRIKQKKNLISNLSKNCIYKTHKIDNMTEIIPFENVGRTGKGKFVFFPKSCIIDTPIIKETTFPMMPRIKQYDGFEYCENTGIYCYVVFNTICMEIVEKVERRLFDFDFFIDE